MAKRIQVYGWSPVSKQPLRGIFYADESPLEPGVYLMPQYTTKKQVPKLANNQCAVYDIEHDDWDVVPDLRGVVMYQKSDGAAVTIDYLGKPSETLTNLPRPSNAHVWSEKSGWILDASLQAALDAELKSHTWELIKQERERRIQTGGYKVGDKWYHSDTFSRTQQMGLVMLGANMPKNLMWKAMDGSFVLMTPTLAQQIFAAAAMSDQETFKAAEVHRAAMMTAENPLKYDHSTGWPATFGEVSL